MRPLNRPRLNAGTTVAGRETATPATNYRQFAQPLIDEFGPYCAFCESPLPGGWDIEHRCAKSTKKDSSKDVVNNWGNLLVACSQCNGIKSDRIKDEHYMSYVVWPDVYNTLLMFRCRSDGVIEVDSDRIKEHLPSLYYSKDTLSSTDQNDIAARLSAKAENTIRVFQLNRKSPYDGRLKYRRQTYELAQTFFEKNIGLQEELFQSMTRATGCWSIWCQILCDPATKIDDKIARSYLRQLLDSTVFAGTSEAISVEDTGPRLTFKNQKKYVEIIYDDEGYNELIGALPTLKELTEFFARSNETKPQKKVAGPSTRKSSRVSKPTEKVSASTLHAAPGNKDKIFSHPPLSSRSGTVAVPMSGKRKREDTDDVATILIGDKKYVGIAVKTSQEDNDVEMMLDDDADNEEATRPHKRSRNDDE